MKNISNYITESANNKIIFNNLAALFLFEAEISGQISDGYWENARPYDHWKWVSGLDVEYDKNIEDPGYLGHMHKKKYSLSWMSTYVRKARSDKDYAWAVRFLNFGKFGRIYPESKWKDLTNNYELRVIVEDLPQEETTMEELDAKYSNTERSWQKNYWDKCKSLFSDELLKKYYSTTYTRDDLEDDLEKAEQTINTMR